MSQLYTKNGKPLQVSGDDIFDRSGRHVGRRRGDKVAYTVRVRIPIRSSAGREIETYEQEFVLRNPPRPLASLTLSIPRYGWVLRAPLNIPTVDADGEALADGTV